MFGANIRCSFGTTDREPGPPIVLSWADGQKKLYEKAGSHATQFRNSWKMLDNPLEESARRDMLPQYSFLLMIAFEGAIKLQEWKTLKGIIEVLCPLRLEMTGKDAVTAQASLRIFECMADLTLSVSEDNNVPDAVTLETMQVSSMR
jgi:hypothetical protein